MEYSGSGDVTGAVAPNVDLVLPPARRAELDQRLRGRRTSPASPPATVALHPARHLRLRRQGRRTPRPPATTAVDHLQRGPGGPRPTPARRHARRPGVDHPGRSARASPSGSELADLAGAAVTRRTRDTSRETAHDRRTSSPTPRRAAPTARSSSAPTSTRSPRARASTTTAAAPRRSSRSPSRWPSSASSRRNQVRFAFWGAEEAGLLGSEHYVATLTDASCKDIALNLNFDMLGSPNYVRFVYDGDGRRTGTAGPTARPRSSRSSSTTSRARAWPTEPTAFDGRSRLRPVHRRRHPRRRPVHRRRGHQDRRAGRDLRRHRRRAYDPCYHQACDTIANINDRRSTSSATRRPTPCSRSP